MFEENGNLPDMSSRASTASRGIYALIGSEMCRKCVDPSTPFHSARDDKILGDSIVFNISVKIGSGRVKTLPYDAKNPTAVDSGKNLVIFRQAEVVLSPWLSDIASQWYYIRHSLPAGNITCEANITATAIELAARRI